jgi:hypothetical protein
MPGNCGHDEIYSVVGPTGTSCTKCYISSYLEEMREHQRRLDWNEEHGYLPGFEVEYGVEYRITMEHCKHADCPYIREGYQHAHTVRVKSDA